MAKKIDATTEKKKETKKRKIVPSHLKEFSPIVQKLKGVIDSDTFRERFAEVKRNYNLMKENSSGATETAFLNALWDLYTFYKKMFYNFAYSRDPELNFKKPKLNTVDKVRIDSRIGSMSKFMNMEIDDYIANLIHKHLYILVEGELNMNVSADSYTNNLK